MSEWKAKRFWKAARATEAENGFCVELDGRLVKTPAKRSLNLPSRALAEAIAREWDAQEDYIKPETMPVTRAANAAIDKVSQQHEEVADLVAEYGGADLLCYRAEGPETLIARQAEAWDPLLDWASEAMGVRLNPVAGIMHRPQSQEAMRILRAKVHAQDAFTLTAFHDLVSLSGSLIIGFAALEDAFPIEKLWQVSRVDESWQQDQWGVDEEAQEHAARKESDFFAAKIFHDLARKS